MAPKRSFDAELAVLETLRRATPEAAQPLLAKALTGRNNFLVAKAADLAVHHGLNGLLPNLAAAFPRFFEGADPQCWAKNAVSKALAKFGCQDAELFLRGMRHVQMEGNWGGASDSAGALRGTCALALVQCRELSSHAVLVHLTPLFADKQLSVRVNAVRAVEQVGTDAAALLLRLRAELASDEPELLGACYSGVLALEGAAALPWAAKFLPPEDDAAAEAAMAMAQIRTGEACTLLRDAWARAKDPWFRSAVLQAIALTRQEDAVEWLLSLVAGQGRDAEEAHTALCRSAPPEAALARLAALGKPCAAAH